MSTKKLRMPKKVSKPLYKYFSNIPLTDVTFAFNDDVVQAHKCFMLICNISEAHIFSGFSLFTIHGKKEGGEWTPF